MKIAISFFCVLLSLLVGVLLFGFLYDRDFRTKTYLSRVQEIERQTATRDDQGVYLPRSLSLFLSLSLSIFVDPDDVINVRVCLCVRRRRRRCRFVRFHMPLLY